jgi:hypothetical protein
MIQEKRKKLFPIHYRNKSEIERKYNCFKCKANAHQLKCTGTLKPIDDVEEYVVEINYEGDKSPKVFIKSPEIEYGPHVHTYKDKSLCLFYPREFRWKQATSIAEYLIPWINEWIIYYECYKIFGVWFGPEAPHTDSDNK